MFHNRFAVFILERFIQLTRPRKTRVTTIGEREKSFMRKLRLVGEDCRYILAK